VWRSAEEKVTQPLPLQGKNYGNIMDMNADVMIGSAIGRIAPISHQIWDASWELAF
jgi:hypothetical protein